ncbi:MAG: hypothetical protein ABDH37_00060 [Candidatus Hydrothermales bacterium]
MGKLKKLFLLAPILFWSSILYSEKVAEPEFKVVSITPLDNKVPSPVFDTFRVWPGATANTTREVAVGKSFKGMHDDTIRIVTVQSAGTRYLVIATDTSTNNFGRNKFRIAFPYTFPTGITANSVALGNVDGDYYTDILVGTGASPFTVYWFEWSEVATSFQLQSSFNAPAAVNDIVIGDADNDGNSNEIILTTATTSPPQIWRYIWQAGSLVGTQINLTGTVAARGVAIGDIRPDIPGNEIYVVGSTNIWMVYWDGSTWVVSTITTGVSASWDIVIGDINLSLPGNEFAVVHGSTSYQVSVWNWTGVWSGIAYRFTATWGTTDNDIAIGDIVTDNYGVEMILVGGASTTAIPYLFWIGPGGSGWVYPLPKVRSGQADYGVAIGNINKFRHFNNEIVLSGGGSLLEIEQRVYPNDIGTYWIRMKNGTAVRNVPDTIIIGIFNAGYLPQSNFNINYNLKIRPISGSVSYLGVLNPNQTDVIKIPFSYTFTGLDTLFVTTALASDQNTANDRTALHLEVYDDTTRCASGFNPVLFPPSNSTVPPTSWQRVILSGIYNWARTTSPSSPAAPVLEGYAVAMYPSYSASSGSMARLITHPISVGNTARKLKLRFYMYGDPGYATNPDSIVVEYSYDAINFMRLASFPRYAATAGWRRFDVDIGDFPPNRTIYVSFLAKSGFGNNMFIDSVRIVATTPTAASNDAQVMSILPISKPTYVGQPYQVKVVIRNLGLNPLTSTQVFYTLGGQDTVKENWTGYLEINSLDTFTFSTPLVFSDTGVYTLYSGTRLTGDQNSQNDVTSTVLRVCPSSHIPPYTKNFDENWLNSTEPPFCGWTIVDGGNEPSPAVNTNDWHRYVSASPARTVARVYFSPVEQHNDWLISPRFDCSAWGTYTLSFWHYYNDWSVASPDSGRVLLSTDGGSTWITLARYSNVDDSGRKTFDISNLVNNKNNVKIAFHYVAYDEFYWYVDDFSLSFVPDNQGPIISFIRRAQNAYRGPFTVKALIRDNVSGLLSDTLYYIVNDQVYVAPRISVRGDTFTYQIPDLPAGTVVDYYLKARDNALNVTKTGIMTFCVLEPFSTGVVAYGVPGENNVKLSWDTPYEEIRHYSYPYYVWSGWSQGDMIATRFTPQYYPYKLEAVAMLFYQYQDTIELLVWRDDGSHYPGVLVYSDTFAITSVYPQYQVFDLSSQNIVISDNDFHVGIKWLGPDRPYIISDDTSFTGRSKIYTGTHFIPFGYDFVISSFVSYLPSTVLNSGKEMKIVHDIDLSTPINIPNTPLVRLKKNIIQNIDSYKKYNLYLDLFGIQNFEILKSQTQGGPYTSIGTTNQTYFVDTDVSSGNIYYYVIATNYTNPDTQTLSNEVQIAVDFHSPVYSNTVYNIVGNELIVSTRITDWSGLYYDTLGYRFDGGNFSFITHAFVSGSNYYYTIPLTSGVGVIEFYLFCRDASWWRNYARDPVSGYYQYTGIGEITKDIPSKFFFNVLNTVSNDGFIKFAYGIPAETEVDITIYSVTGRKIKTLVNGVRKPGVYYLLWNKEDEKGKKVGQGTYLVKVKTKEKEEIKKIILIR